MVPIKYYYCAHNLSQTILVILSHSKQDLATVKKMASELVN